MCTNQQERLIPLYSFVFWEMLDEKAIYSWRKSIERAVPLWISFTGLAVRFKSNKCTFLSFAKWFQKIKQKGDTLPRITKIAFSKLFSSVGFFHMSLLSILVQGKFVLRMWDTVSVLGYITSFKNHILWDSHEKSYERLMHTVFITACFNNNYLPLFFIHCLWRKLIYRSSC